jgi:enoyl-CoA hydratase/carnithine racemase
MTAYRGRPSREFNFRYITYSKSSWRATLTINRPDVYNCLNLATLQEMGLAFQDAAWDDQIAVLVITGAGTKAFCTGADMKEWKEDFLKRPNDFYKWMGVFTETFERLRNIGKPTVARLNGMVVGGGNELQMSCDLAVAADDIVIRHAGTSRGSVAAAGASQWLPLMIGERRAREVLLLNEEIPAKKALSWGLVNRVVPRRRLDKTVDALVEQLIDKLPESTRYTKQQLNFWRDLSWSLTVGHLRDWLTVHTASEETREGILAFSEKRKIDYRKLRKQLTHDNR